MVRHHRGPRRRLATALTAALAALAALPGAAQAATASLSGGTLTVIASSYESNKVNVTRSGDYFTVSDRNLNAGAGCSRVSGGGDDDEGGSDRVRCAAASVSAISISTGSHNDSAINRTSTPATIDGGSGNDWVTGGGGADSLAGGAGSDLVWARDSVAVADSVSCGTESDTTYVDALDSAAADCETVNRSTAGGGTSGGGGTGGGTGGTGGGAGGGSGTGVEIPVSIGDLGDLVDLSNPGPVLIPPLAAIEVEDKLGRAALLVACPEVVADVCDGWIDLYVDADDADLSAAGAAPARRRGRVKIGRARFSVSSGHLESVDAKLTRRGRAIVKTKPRVRVLVKLTRRGGGAVDTRRVVIKRAKKKPKKPVRRRR